VPLRQGVDHLEVNGGIGRYEDSFSLFSDHSPLMVLFLGSTIGNFNQDESLRFWKRVASSLQIGDYFLLGADLVKERAVLETAYNDAAGVTARFTKNLFARMNRELDAAWDLDAIEHIARFNERWQRIEIHARFLRSQTATINPPGIEVTLGAGDEVLVEISRKFVLSDLVQYVKNFGFTVCKTFTDERNWFSLLLLRRVPGEAPLRRRSSESGGGCGHPEP